jgi:hypothetical protein
MTWSYEHINGVHWKIFPASLYFSLRSAMNIYLGVRCHQTCTHDGHLGKLGLTNFCKYSKHLRKSTFLVVTFVKCWRIVKCYVLVTYRYSFTPGRCSVQQDTSVLSTDSNWGCGVAAGGLATVWGCGINFCPVVKCPQIWPSLFVASFLELHQVPRQKSPKVPEWFSRLDKDSFFYHQTQVHYYYYKQVWMNCCCIRISDMRGTIQWRSSLSLIPGEPFNP